MELTECPQNSSTILVTFLVETPEIYLSAIASLRAFLLRMPFFQRDWIKGDAVPDLKNAEFDESHARGEGLRLEPIGEAKASLRALVRLCWKDGNPLLKRGLIDE